jgi:hypothetical protein
LIWIGSEIRQFIETHNQDLAIKIIRTYPEIIFADAIEISLALFMTNPSLSYKDMISLKYNSDDENPIRAQVLKWSMLTEQGNPKEQKRPGSIWN